MIVALSLSFSVQVSLPYSGFVIARVLYIRNLLYFWTLEGFRTWLMIPMICKNKL
jgi:hypothetical protein